MLAEARAELARLERLLAWQVGRLTELEESKRSVEVAAAGNRAAIVSLRERLEALDNPHVPNG